MRALIPDRAEDPIPNDLTRRFCNGGDPFRRGAKLSADVPVRESALCHFRPCGRRCALEPYRYPILRNEAGDDSNVFSRGRFIRKENLVSVPGTQEVPLCG